MSVLLSAIKPKAHAKPVKTDKEIAACLAPQTIMSVLLPAIKLKAHAKPVKTDKKIVACAPTTAKNNPPCSLKGNALFLDLLLSSAL